MSSPYTPQPPKRLERSKSNRVLGGVCAGVANYLNMDPTLVRVLTVVISLFTGVPVILYIIALFVVPEEGSQPASPTYPPVGGPQGQAAGYPPAPPQAAQPAYTPSGTSGPPQSFQQPPAPPASAEDSVWGSEGRPGSSVSPPPEPTWSLSQNPRVPQSPRRRSLLRLTRRTPPSRHRNLEGPEERPAMTDNPATEPPTGTDSAQASDGGQQTDKS